ncbi:uncharacterized protein MEPE_05189 [Melanopsichium pennsylvanicum]|uniref:Uncharacterized protein n=2 Tax=Melanopsichium pennsylvanicum TaxID=63383 RepID=A0AAJ4XPM7_9BASI|nr:putative protein [Melanopsichium pennsylvanicum 4]SNX86480.1 uncharacterized protein MEPE_05189 [Melanopsichium pennsylvanicum]
MSTASTQQHLHRSCSAGCNSGEQAQPSSHARSSLHQSPATPVHQDHHTSLARQASQPPASSSFRPDSKMRHSSVESDRSHRSQSDISAHQHQHAGIPPQSLPLAQAQDARPLLAWTSPAGSTPQPAATASASTPPKQIRLPTAAQRRRARELATVLLSLATCQGCQRPVQDAVTLPCGHSSCLQCIKDRILPKSIPSEDQVLSLPCVSHLPPRLPLSPMTVPCPAHGCPRSAIGRGIGVWDGHQPRYGLIPTYTERLPLGTEDVGPGAPPVDGFVMGVADHPLRLTVIGPQTRSKAHLFAVPPQGVEPNSMAAGAQHHPAATLLPSLASSNLLRADVTLSKAVAILIRYASSPLPRPPRQRRGIAGSGGPPTGSSSRSRYSRRGRGRSANDQSTSATSRARGGIRIRRSVHRNLTGRTTAAVSLSSRRFQQHGTSQAGMGIFGRNESELESGTVGGVRAVSDSEEESSRQGADDSDDDTTTDTEELSYRRRLVRSMHAHRGDHDDDDEWTVHAVTDDEERTEEEDNRLWPDHVGGAFSRPPLPTSSVRRRGKARLKRRRGRPSDDSASSAASLRKANATHAHTEGKFARREAAESMEDVSTRHLDSGWSTEDSTASACLDSENNAEALVDAVRRCRARQLHGGTNPGSEVDSDPDLKAHDRFVEAKHSLALSSRVGANGQPLIQTVATLHSELVEVLECQLCYLLLYNPLTTPCGHTFCKSCFARSLDHGDRCPLCRAEMPNFSFFQDHRPNSALLKILTSDTATFSDEDVNSDSTQEAKAYAGISVVIGDSAANQSSGRQRTGCMVDDDPETAPHHYGFKRLYEQRKSAIEQEEREARLSTPIFVCTLAFPGMPTILHIFEPRYRLMVRRCLESVNPRFGMVLPSRTNGGTEEYGTMLEIKSVQMLADGRSMLETVGSYRFKLLEKGSLDGYTVGRVERVDDISLEEEAELERQVLLRRTELERNKAHKEVERPKAASMVVSSSAPVRTMPSEGEPLQASGSVGPARPQMPPRSESDALSIYRTAASSNEGTQQQPEPAQSTNDPEDEAINASSAPDNDIDRDESEIPPFAPVPKEPSLAELTEICTSFIETLRSGSAPWLLSRLNHTYGPMPSADEVERLGYWMALVMPIDEHEKAKLLPIRSRRLRLCLVVHWIEQLRQSWWFNSGCTVS